MAFIDTLTAAHARAGDFEQAEKFQTRALASPEFAAGHGAEARARLKRYGQKRPYDVPPVAPPRPVNP